MSDGGRQCDEKSGEMSISGGGGGNGWLVGQLIGLLAEISYTTLVLVTIYLFRLYLT